MNNQEYNRRRYETIYKPAYVALMKFYPLSLEDLPGELWKPIPSRENYQISNYGRAKSFNGLWVKAKILKPILHNSGYLQVGLRKAGKKKLFLVHRLVAQAFIPNPENKPTVNHRDGCRFNNYVSNLEWVTSAENNQHAVITGLRPSGQDCPEAKLTVQQVCYIRENSLGLTTAELGKMFGVNSRHISRIQLGQRWKQVGGSVRDKIDTRLPDEVRAQIRAEYVYGSHEFGSYGLAKKYGVSQQTIRRIIYESQS